ncbi:MAG: phage tail protein [Candidatus Omnitrophota bacterium]
MADCFLGEIRMFGGNYAPQDWAFCNGQLMPINQNDALYALIGVTYGGDGQVNFNLPDFRGRVAVHRGTGSGLTPRTIGQTFGTETAALTNANQLPAHTHTLSANGTASNTDTPSATTVIGPVTSTNNMKSFTALNTTTVSMNSAAISSTTGGSQAHNNLMPSLCVSFIIALNGLFPTQS